MAGGKVVMLSAGSQMPRKPRMSKYKSKSKRPKTSKALSKKIERGIVSHAEKKKIRPVKFLNNRITNFLNDPATQAIPLIPTVPQGVGQGERNGNSITTRRAILSLNMHHYQLTTSSGYVPPTYFDIYIYKYKRSDNVAAIDFSKFLQFGNTAQHYNSAPGGDAFSGNQKVNTDSFTLKYQKRIVLFNQSTSNLSGINAIRSITDVMNARNFKIDITKYLKKEMRFQDAISNTPDDNLYLSVVFTPNDYDTTAYAQNFVIGEFQAQLEYEYIDI
jgi:hypothetical protein